MRKKRNYSRKTRKFFGLGISRPFVNKRNRLILGSGRRIKIRKQKGGFFAPLLTALAPTAAELISNIIK